MGGDTHQDNGEVGILGGDSRVGLAFTREKSG